MMLITLDGCYLIDRTFTFRRVQMRFPCKITNDVCVQLFYILQNFLIFLMCKTTCIFGMHSDISIFFLVRVLLKRHIILHCLMGR